MIAHLLMKDFGILKIFYARFAGKKLLPFLQILFLSQR
nr:MAG TPA: hypothetical protein [Caudoviricetes sp.]